MVRICPRSTPAIASSTRKLNCTAGIAPESVRSVAAVWVVITEVAVVSTVPANIIPARRDICLHCGPRTRSAITSDCCAAAKFERKSDRQAITMTNTRLDAPIASLFLEGTGPGQVLGVESDYCVRDQADVRAVTAVL